MLMVVNCLSARSLMQRPVEPSIFLEQVAFLFPPPRLTRSPLQRPLRVSFRSSLPTSHTKWWCKAASAEHLRSKNYNFPPSPTPPPGLQPLRELESRRQLCAREIDSGPEIRRRSIAQSRARSEKCAKRRLKCR